MVNTFTSYVIQYGQYGVGLCNQGLVEEPAQNNLRRGTIQIQDEVRHLLCLLTRDVADAGRSLFPSRVKLALRNRASC